MAAVGALLLLVPGSPPITQPGPDPLEAATAASSDLGIDAAAVDVADLGSKWSVTFARVEQQRDVTQWHVGYLSPEQRRVDVEQTATPTLRWLTADEGRAVAATAPVVLDQVMAARSGAKAVEVGGVSWWQFTAGDGSPTLARQLGAVDGVADGASQGSVLLIRVASDRGVADRDEVAAALAQSAALDK